MLAIIALRACARPKIWRHTSRLEIQLWPWLDSRTVRESWSMTSDVKWNPLNGTPANLYLYLIKRGDQFRHEYVQFSPASVSMLILFESRYTLNGRYNIGNVGQTASTSVFTLFESRYTFKGRYNIAGKTTCIRVFLYSLWIKIYQN